MLVRPFVSHVCLFLVVSLPACDFVMLCKAGVSNTERRSCNEPIIQLACLITQEK
jgi:hypothetical protein